MTEDERLLPMGSELRQSVIYAIVFVWATYLLVQARNWPNQDRLFPVIISVFVVILVPIQLSKIHFPELMSAFTDGGEMLASTMTEPKTERTKREREMHALIVIGWLTAFFLISYVFGFLYSIPLFVFSFIWYYLRDARTALIITAAFTVVSYLLFIELLSLRVWRGVVELPLSI